MGADRGIGSRIFTGSGVVGDNWRQPVRLRDNTNASKPTGSVTIDGVTPLANGDRVLFTNLSGAQLGDNNKVFRAVVSAGLVTGWNLDTDGQPPNGSPRDGNLIYVQEGTSFGDKIYKWTGSGWSEVGAGGGGANTSLSNLTATAVNVSINPNTDNTITLGTSLLRWSRIDSVRLMINNSLLDVNVTESNVVRMKSPVRIRRSDSFNSSYIDMTNDSATAYIGVDGPGFMNVAANELLLGSIGAINTNFAHTGVLRLKMTSTELRPATAGGMGLGTSSLPFNTSYFAGMQFWSTGGGQFGVISFSGTNFNFNTNNNTNFNISTGSGAFATGAINLTTGAPTINNNSGAIALTTANATGTGNSGNITLTTGTIASGTRGTIRFVDASLALASAGFVWTLQDALTGAGAWAAASGAASSGVTGSVQFSNGAGGFSSDGAQFFWNDTTKRLGIRTNAPIGALDVIILGGSANGAYFLSGHTAGDRGLAIEDNGVSFINLQGTNGSLSGALPLGINTSGGDVHLGGTGSTIRPAVTLSENFGTSSFIWNTAHINTITAYSQISLSPSGTNRLNIGFNATTPSGASVQAFINLQTGNNFAIYGAGSGALYFETANQAGNSSLINIQTGTSSGGATGAISLATGAAGGGGASGAISITSGTSSGIFATGTVALGSGNYIGVGSGQSGGLTLFTGSAGGSGPSGSVAITTGNVSGTGSSGAITLQTGTVTSGTRGDLLLRARRIDVTSQTITHSGASYGVDQNDMASVMRSSVFRSHTGFANVFMSAGAQSNTPTTPTFTDAGTVFYMGTDRGGASSGHSLAIITQSQPFDTAASGGIAVLTGDQTNSSAGNRQSGRIYLKTGNISHINNPGVTGAFDILTGSSIGQGTTGAINIITGANTNATAGSTGGINITTGLSTAGTRGDITLTSRVVALVTTNGVTVTGNVNPSAAVTYNLGSPTGAWNILYTRFVLGRAADFTVGSDFNTGFQCQIQSGHSNTAANTGVLNVFSGDILSAGTGTPGAATFRGGDILEATNGNNTSLVTLRSGNTSGGGNSGNIAIQTGTVTTGVRGSITLTANNINLVSSGDFDVSGVTQAKGVFIWKKYTISHTVLQAAALTNDAPLFTLPIMGAIQAVVISHTVAFAGTGITGYTVSVGVAGNLTKYAGAFDVFQAPGNQVEQSSLSFDLENKGVATSIRIAATSVGANLDQSTGGSVDVWVLWCVLP